MKATKVVSFILLPIPLYEKVYHLLNKTNDMQEHDANEGIMSQLSGSLLQGIYSSFTSPSSS